MGKLVKAFDDAAKKAREKEQLKSEFKQHDKEHPSYVLVQPGTDLGNNNHLKIEIDPYNIKTVADFLEVDSEEEQNNRINHLFKFIHKEFDELVLDKIIDYLVGKGRRRDTLKRIAKKEYDILFPKQKQTTDITQNLFEVANYLKNVQSFYERQPFFYDNNELFWFWNKELNKYEIVDTVDLMNSIEDSLYMFGQTISSSVKANYIEAFKRVGRKKHPKPAPKKWIQFKDKAFSIKSKKIYDVQPNYFFTNPIPWRLGGSTETPYIDKLFKDWVGEEYVDTLYEIVAYCCFTDYPIHRIFALIGSGCNGKSKFQQLLRNFIGVENATATELDILLESRFESAKLYKKLACIMGETNFGVMNKTSLLKKLSGQDLIGFEFKNKKPFEDCNYAKLLINSNSMPSSEDTSEGFFRRWLIIDFPNKFKEGKDILKDVPKEEYNNLALKITKILPDLLERGEFTNEGGMEERKKRYIMASNPLPYFIEHCMYQNPQGYIRYAEFYMKYTKFLDMNKKRIVSKKEFSKVLNMEGFENRRTSKNGEVDYYVEGLEMKENLPDLPDFHKFSTSSPYRKAECKKAEIGEIKSKTKEIQPIVSEEKIYHKCTICSDEAIKFDEIDGKPYCLSCYKQKNQQ